MIADGPKRRRTSSSEASSASLQLSSRGSMSWPRPLSRLLIEIPTRVMPWRSMSGTATASSCLAAARIVCVFAVA